MSTRDLIDAIESGNSSAIQQHFQDAIMSRVAERLDTMRIETAKNMFKSSVNEAVINTSDYHSTSEKSQFGGFRPLVKHKDTGDTMYLSAHSYKTPDDAKDHADEYLKAYAHLGPIHADRAANSFVNANKHKLMESSVNEAWDNYTVHWSSPNSDRVNKSTVYGPSDDHEKMKAHLNANQFNVGKIHKVEPYTGKVAASSDPKSHRSYVESVELDEATLSVSHHRNYSRPGQGPDKHTITKDHGDAPDGSRVYSVKQPNGFHGVFAVKDNTVVGSSNTNLSKDEAHSLGAHYAKHGTVGIGVGKNWSLGSGIHGKAIKEKVELDEAIDSGPRGNIKTDNIRYGQVRGLAGYSDTRARDLAAARTPEKPVTQKAAPVKALPPRIDTTSDKLRDALENNLGGSFEHFESDPRHHIVKLPDGRDASAIDTVVTHSYSHEDLGLPADEMADTAETYPIRVIDHPDHGFVVQHRPWSMHESADDDYIHQVLADNDINSQISGNVVHVDHDNVEKAQELVKAHGYDHKVMGGLNEVLSKKDPASKWIADFVKSDDPKFKGKTKKERIKMALGAYYGAQRNESAELDEGFPYDVDHMPGRRLSMANVNKTSKYTVATNAIGGHKEHRVEVDATSKNHARNLAADHFMKNGLKPRVHFDGVRVVNEETECNKDDKMNETSCETKKKWGAIKDSMKDSVKK